MSLGALTTAFAPVASCRTSLDHIHAVGTTYLVKGPVSVDDCFPANYKPSPTNYYSPGVCPSGYISACSSLSTLGDATETTVTCCPTSMYCQTALNVQSYPWELTFGCTSAITGTIVETVTVISNGLVVTTTVESTSGGINAFSYQIRFQSTDFHTSSSTSSPTSSSTAVPLSKPSTSPISTTPTSTTTPSSGNSSGLSKGAIGGIAAGSAVGGILFCLAIGAAFWVGRKRAARRRNARENAPLYPQPERDAKVELPPDHRISELEGNHPR